MRTDREVIVVGAGVAGLAVAAELCGLGVDVVCVEARERIGGRLLTIDSDRGRLDLGASWFWPGEERVAALVADRRIPVHPQHIAGDAVYDPHGRPRRLDGNPIDAPAHRFSLGAQSLAWSLAEALPAGTLLLDSPVSLVEGAADGARVHAGRTGMTARQVVMAVPPALAVQTIRFEPALPAEVDRLARLTPVWMGNMTKVVAVYPEPFWREAGLSGAAVSEVGPLREVHDLSGPGGDDPAALFGFAPAAGPGGGPEPDLVARQLARLFGPRAGEPRQLVIQDWSQEPWTAPAGGDRPGAAYQLFGHPLYGEPVLAGRLHWASTETATVSPGHIEGALAAAARATTAVLTALHPAPAGPGRAPTRKDR